LAALPMGVRDAATMTASGTESTSSETKRGRQAPAPSFNLSGRAYVWPRG
jgi:hypothetical protein